MAKRVTTGDLIERLAHLREGKRGTILVAIDGQGGAGKSSLAARIKAELPDVTTICLDDFGRPGPSGWDHLRFIDQVLDPVLHGRQGRYQRWDWVTDSPAEWHDVPVGGVLVVEGVYASRDEIGHPWDLTVWVEAPFEVRLARGVTRDGEEMRTQWTEVWMPAEDAYVVAQRPHRRADVVIDGTAVLA